MKRMSAASAVILLFGTIPAAAHATPGQPDPAPAGQVAGRIIVEYAEGTPAQVQQRTEDAVAAVGDVELTGRTSVDEQTRVVQLDDPAATEEVITDLRAQPGVISARPALRMRAFTDSLTPAALPSTSWNLLGAPGGSNLAAAWSRSTGTGQVIAVIDSGVVTHPDLAGHLLPGYDFLSDPSMSRDGDGWDANPADQGDWEAAGYCGAGEQAKDSSWHGSHVTGIAAAGAPGAKILPVRGLGACGGSEDDVAAAIRWSAGLPVSGAPSNPNPADVINLSLGVVAQCTPILQEAISAAAAKGVTVVTAAGNLNMDAAKVMPGNCTGVINIAAAGKTGTKASYSNHSAVALSAPGGDNDALISSTGDSGTTTPVGATYRLLAGTSQASPHVAAAVALAKALNPALSASQITTGLRSTARPFAVTPNVPMGAGILDAAAFLNTVAPQTPTPAPTPAPVQTPTPTPTPSDPTTPTQPTARVFGTDRVRTAVAASRTWWNTAKTVYLASSEAFPDALSAGPAAARVGAPLLLSPSSQAPSSVTAEILRLSASKVVIVGGPAAISTDVERQLRDLGVQTVRLAGKDRYATNAAVAATFGKAATGYLASGTAYADATNAGAAASISGAPLLLSAPTSLPAATTATLKTLGTSRVNIVGGTAVVGVQVSKALGSTMGTRYAGATRYETAADLVAATASGRDHLIITSGENWPDSLVAGPVVAKTGAVMLPVRATCTPPVISAVIAKLSPVTTTILGGKAVVADAARTTTCR